MSNVCNQIKNREKNTNRLLRVKERSDVGARVTTRVGTFENAADALLVEIREMLSDRRNDILASGQTHMSDISSLDVRLSTVTDNDIEEEILDGLCTADAA